jgi:hypothetical protein
VAFYGKDKWIPPTFCSLGNDVRNAPQVQLSLSKNLMKTRKKSDKIE